MVNAILNFVFNHTPIFYLTQSIWRDEGFSYFMAKANVWEIILNSIQDFNPPLYYITLHFWMKIFGESDITLRMMSFVFHILSVYVAYLLVKKIFEEKFAFFVAALVFFNPMLMYYAFELRMYSMYAFFTLASLYFFIQKRWRPFTIVSTLGIYTHSFFIFVILSEIIYLYFQKELSRQTFKKVFKPIIFFIPWIPFMIWQFLESKNSWIFPVDLQLITSALGNLFTSYEGTPGRLWGWTALLSLIILIFVYFGFRKNRKYGLLFGILTLVPLSIVLAYSVLRRPIYVNRYLMFVTIGEIMAMATFIYSLKNRKQRYYLMGIIIVFSVVLNVVSASFHRKVDIRSTILEIKSLSKKDDVIYANSSLVYFESAFYFQDQSRVFIYNPSNVAIPKYVGTAVIPPSKSKMDFPEKPARTFLVKTNGSYELIEKEQIK
ncbi:hypothetical protein A2773_04070 [Candidatus Gottesmanbacteria bacterium RIFCSPHIGHO2_01_FULL_39_10]|uniref:Glycosyltransferase RgtA/B/C/D-like domain-containing protein n=1 Tax=Candidatus Gottesmanbacteria bacterium RIFCSPHIGHO2_01_FULL_39_10 TaxID=1798375 RepID=A0A1F5ZQV4_9BACT|nr:MAG: hypothetical protein A2773_04070 [Candidatus Gottesmanbacteria bacterium RIFCSPHIGHO2_01_FULL_39_10]